MRGVFCTAVFLALFISLFIMLPVEASADLLENGEPCLHDSQCKGVCEFFFCQDDYDYATCSSEQSTACLFDGDCCSSAGLACDGGVCKKNECFDDVQPGGACATGGCCDGYDCLYIGQPPTGVIGDWFCVQPDDRPEGQKCDADDQCASGLICRDGECNKLGKVGDPCLRNEECAEGLECWYPDGPGCWFKPPSVEERIKDHICESIWNYDHYQKAISSGKEALSFGVGLRVSALASGLFEVGNIYSKTGRYGCYSMACPGVNTNVGIKAYASYAEYPTYSPFTVDETEIEVFNQPLPFSLAGLENPFPWKIYDQYGLIGDAYVQSCPVCGKTKLPVDAGHYWCFTDLNVTRDDYSQRMSASVIGDKVFVSDIWGCEDLETCADEETCDAGPVFTATYQGIPVPMAVNPEGPYGIGSSAVIISAGESTPFGPVPATCSLEVSVNDCTPPDIVCPDPVTAECTDDPETVVDPGDAEVTDCSDYQVTDPGPTGYPLGTTEVVYTATDTSGNESSCSTSVTVQDTQAPVIFDVDAEPALLWPPNHTMRSVEITVDATDVCEAEPHCEIVTVTSSEPENGTGDGDTSPDWVVTDDLTLDVRAERAGTGIGRVYTVEVACSDTTGNISTGTTSVTVPTKR